MKDFWNWLIGLPKCVKGGRCNQEKTINKRLQYLGKNEGIPSFYRPKEYYCTKCKINTTEYGKI